MMIPFAHPGTRRRAARYTAAAVLISAVTFAAHAQPRIPKRPRLPERADSNSAQAYYSFGIESIRKRPDLAADAFYWASRLAPPWPEPYYGRAIALLLEERSRLVRYIERDRVVLASKESRRIDSLLTDAYRRNPFLVSRLDFHVYEEYISQLTDGDAVGLFRGKTGDPAFDGWMAYMQGNHARAIDYYAKAIEREPGSLELHVDRARAFSALTQYDSAVSEMSRLLDKMREHKKDELDHAFESIAMFEYSVGYLHSRNGSDSLARDAYERALTIDLSFHVAHVALGDIATRRGDTATAIREYGQAVDLEPEDGGLRAGYALALIQANRQAEAVEQLKKSIELEPYFAQPYFLLGRLYDRAGYSDEAIATYEAFVARAAAALPEREWARNRVTALRAATP